MLLLGTLKLKVINFFDRYIPGGTCGGDSGAPLLTTIEGENLNILEIRTQQIAVLHGGLEQCSNTRYPAIYTR